MHPPIVRNADGHGLDLDRPAAVLHQHVGPVHAAAQTPLGAVQEVEAVVLGVEPDHVTAQHALEYLVRPGEDPHDVPRWERDMEEEAHLDADFLLHAGVPDRVGRQHEVVVMKPDNWSLTSQQKYLPKMTSNAM